MRVFLPLYYSLYHHTLSAFDTRPLVDWVSCFIVWPSTAYGDMICIEKNGLQKAIWRSYRSGWNGWIMVGAVDRFLNVKRSHLLYTYVRIWDTEFCNI